VLHIRAAAPYPEKRTLFKSGQGDPCPAKLAAVAGQAIERTYNVPRDRVWDALTAKITGLGYKDVTEDRGAWTIEYRTGLSFWSWRGQRMTAVVRGGRGSSVISLTGHGDIPQLTSWGEKKRLARRVLDRGGHRVSD
jgi:hypothetical protein